MSQFQFLYSIPVANTLGECIVWHREQESVWWTDIPRAKLYRHTPANSAFEQYSLPQALCSFGFIQNDSRIICAFAEGFALYDLSSGQPEWLAQPELHLSGNRFNDGRVDPWGRFWSGTKVDTPALDASGNPVSANLYCLTGRRCEKKLSDVQISNSLCWDTERSRMYFADSPRHQIEFFNIQNGELTNRQTFAHCQPPAAPDGSTVDATGYLWNAEWAGGRVARYHPDGQLDCALQLPVTQPTCICFGGPNLDWLFITTAREGLSQSELANQPLAGHVLVYKTVFRGLPEHLFQLDQDQ